MAIQSFERAVIDDNQPCSIFIGGEEYRGFFANVRIDRDSAPKGWHVYDMRHDDFGDCCQIRNGYIMVNHLGTFCCRKALPIPENGSLFRVENEDEEDNEDNDCDYTLW